ncbi:MAG TPA: hypothetical protein VNJ51_14710 [Candidatus Dormibacteraeota bacterium]|nr:hypothetical protein [Candidatus Dormibacteraeota bacterium]
MKVPALSTIGAPLAALTLLSLLAACGGGGSGGMYGGSTVTTPYVSPTPAATAQPQVIGLALPQSTIGTVTDPTFGVIGGYTQSTYSQVLAFVPGSQVMLRNLAASTPHTLDVIGNAAGGFPSSPALSTTPAGGSTLTAGYASGTLNGGSLIGPLTLAQGTYFIGCAFHYATNAMRDVLIVQPNATPGPQATPPSSGAVIPCPGNYC